MNDNKKNSKKTTKQSGNNKSKAGALKNGKSFTNNKFKTKSKFVSPVKKASVPTPNKVEKPKDETLYLIYMTQNEITAKTIHEYFVEKSIESDIWEALNILQLELSNKNTVEFEPMESFTEKADLAFVKNREIKTMFALTIEKSDFEENKGIFKGMLEQLDGFICTDTEDFNPIYKVEDM